VVGAKEIFDGVLGACEKVAGTGTGKPSGNTVTLTANGKSVTLTNEEFHRAASRDNAPNCLKCNIPTVHHHTSAAGIKSYIGDSCGQFAPRAEPADQTRAEFEALGTEPASGEQAV
jgi:hypothetical protein